ncbi:hypothetical protein CAS74_002813 [Pichia kudriavzevii]|uniref:Uncharacterized protein n=1 Tax=Pichia kudriavzevii TaxID=4909 RepID=A0A1Z8JMN5_PICKU|nr:hypothetical protein CAS74_002813 [Pichia kudriavzevii]
MDGRDRLWEAINRENGDENTIRKDNIVMREALMRFLGATGQGEEKRVGVQRSQHYGVNVEDKYARDGCEIKDESEDDLEYNDDEDFDLEYVSKSNDIRRVPPEFVSYKGESHEESIGEVAASAPYDKVIDKRWRSKRNDRVRKRVRNVVKPRERRRSEVERPKQGPEEPKDVFHTEGDTNRKGAGINTIGETLFKMMEDVEDEMFV